MAVAPMRKLPVENTRQLAIRHHSSRTDGIRAGANLRTSVYHEITHPKITVAKHEFIGDRRIRLGPVQTEFDAGVTAG